MTALLIGSGFCSTKAQTITSPELTAILAQPAAGEVVAIELWPEGAPTKNGLEGTEEKVDGNRISHVSNPVLYVYPAEKPNGKMIIDCPGGAYLRLAFAHEGTDMAAWFNSMGITYAVLKYRMPNGIKEVPLEDGRRAIDIVRSRAAEWGVDPAKVGIMGGSAGGHFAATLATLYGDEKYRPAFQILLYPVISMGEITHKGSRDNLLGDSPTPEEIEWYSLANRVDAQTPPAFIAVSADDKAVPAANSLEYAQALINAYNSAPKDAAVKSCKAAPVSLHVYPTGGHGWGFRGDFPYKPLWTAELAAWLENVEF